MKKAKKILTLALSACLLVAISVGVTVAYLTDDDTVTNTFTVGNVQIKLDEADVYEFGDENIPEDKTFGDAIKDAERVQKNSYKLFPGHEYVKDPTVTVLANSEECYIRAFVTVSNKDELDEIFAAHEIKDISTVIGGISSDWECYDCDRSGSDIVYEMRYIKTPTVATSDKDQGLDAIFEKIIVPGELTNDEIQSLKDMTITVVAQAIQADGFADADKAWAAFPAK